MVITDNLTTLEKLYSGERIEPDKELVECVENCMSLGKRGYNLLMCKGDDTQIALFYRLEGSKVPLSELTKSDERELPSGLRCFSADSEGKHRVNKLKGSISDEYRHCADVSAAAYGKNEEILGIIAVLVTFRDHLKIRH